MTNTTKKYRNLAVCFKSLSILATLMPLFIYVCKGYAVATAAGAYTLSVMLIIALVLIAFNIVLKYHIRSAVWFILLGITVCLENITWLLVVMAILTILDEFVLTPLHKRFKAKYTINYEIDKRIE